MALLSRPLFWCLVLFSASILAWIVGSSTQQWDFQTYYFAAKAYYQGQLSPYNLQDLSWVGGKNLYPFVYPPISLPLFRPFLLLPPQQAALLFLALKLLALVFLIRLWFQVFLKNEDRLSFLAFSVLAFHSPIYRDIVAGNISTFEQLGLWFAFAFLLQGRYALFSVLIVLVSSIKLVPIAFLGILPFTRYPYRWRAFLLGVLGFASLLLFSTHQTPQLFQSFLRVATSLKETPLFDPSTMSVARNFLQNLSIHLTLPLPTTFPHLLGFFACFSFFLLTTLTLLRLRDAAPPLPAPEDTEGQTAHQEHLRLLIFFFCTSLPLVLPRFKDYTYILLLVPTYILIRRIAPRAGLAALFLLFCLSMDTGIFQGMPPILSLPGLRFLYSIVQTGFPWFLALVAWLSWRSEIHRTLPEGEA